MYICQASVRACKCPAARRWQSNRRSRRSRCRSSMITPVVSECRRCNGRAATRRRMGTCPRPPAAATGARCGDSLARRFGPAGRDNDAAVVNVGREIGPGFDIPLLDISSAGKVTEPLASALTIVDIRVHPPVSTTCANSTASRRRRTTEVWTIAELQAAIPPTCGR